MALHQEAISEVSGGFSKEIEAGAIEMIFDNLQKHQYQYPQKSTIREVVSNALDGIREKKIARSIITGLSKVEDHYATVEGEIYKDSQFNPAYYQLEFLSENDFVTIVYKDGGDVGKDTVVITDHGVGLGGDRLRGYFNLGYSTKRLNKFALGKFGLGAKSPLATGAPFYTMTSHWNGHEFQFNVYGHKVESIVPRFNLETREENPQYEFSNGYTCHYRKTTEPNGVQIEFQVKKHHKQQYIDAVTSQLLYFSNIQCYIEDVNGYRTNIQVHAQIMYEDDKIVLANNSPYSKPHLLLNGVNYGYIDFRELDLEEKLGNVGIKVQPELVSINPSRESLIWDDATRETVMQRFHEVVGIAESAINKELQESDFLRWLQICAASNGASSMFSDRGDDTIIGRLMRIVDMSKISLRYPKDKNLRFNGDLMDGMNIDVIEVTKTRKGSSTVTKVEYSTSWSYGMTYKSQPIFLRTDKLNNRKSKYIGSVLYPQGFIVIRLNRVIDVAAGEKVLASDIPEIAYKKRLSPKDKDNAEAALNAAEYLANIQTYLQESANIMWYENIEVPSDFKATESDEEETIEEAEDEEAAYLSAAERRKLNGRTVLSTTRNTGKQYGDKQYEWQKVEVPFHIIDTWSNEEIFYSSQEHEVLLHTASLITRVHEAPYHMIANSPDRAEAFKKTYTGVYDFNVHCLNNFQDDSKVRLIKVAQDNVKYYQDFKHITKFFKDIRNKKITMSNALVRWNTARIIKQHFHKLQFMAGLETINPDIHNEFLKIQKYVDANYRTLDFGSRQVAGAEPNHITQLVSHLDKVGQFQLFVKENPEDKSAIAELAQRMFNPAPGVEIEDGLAIDLCFYEPYLKLLDWAGPIEVMLNMVDPLVRVHNLTGEQEEEIRRYCQYRGVKL